MTPFERAYVEREQYEAYIEDALRLWLAGDESIRAAFPASNRDAAYAAIKNSIDRLIAEEIIFKNDTYQVNVRKASDMMMHLSIKRIDRKPIHDWRDLQRIKSEIVGPENEAVEIYPAESRVVDTANQFHLWVFTDATYRLPFGFHGQGRIVCDKSVGGSVNRPFKPEGA